MDKTAMGVNVPVKNLISGRIVQPAIDTPHPKLLPSRATVNLPSPLRSRLRNKPKAPRNQPGNPAQNGGVAAVGVAADAAALAHWRVKHRAPSPLNQAQSPPLSLNRRLRAKFRPPQRLLGPRAPKRQPPLFSLASRSANTAQHPQRMPQNPPSRRRHPQNPRALLDLL